MPPMPLRVINRRAILSWSRTLLRGFLLQVLPVKLRRPFVSDFLFNLLQQS